VCPLRSYVRQAKRLIEDRGRCVQHMQKALTEMNVRLDSVISDIMGKTGEAILRAIVSGERDCHRLASLRDGRIRASAETIAASLEGTWREEHLVALEQALYRYDVFTAQLDACEGRIAAAIDSLTPPYDPETGEIRNNGDGDDPIPHTDATLAHALHRMMGVDLTRIPTIGAATALTVAAEIGPDFSAFPSAQHFSSWLGLAPGTRISGGKRLSGRGSTVVNKLARSLRMAAVTARRSQTFIGARHRSRLARLEKAVAVNATARELACLIYLMVTQGTEYVERGMEAHERNRTQRAMTSLTHRARQLGFALVAIDENQPTANVAISTA
ncbi:MAG: IS110 family transposase, partial [bacterium]|nr:IS110 family transposase [bacterium]